MSGMMENGTETGVPQPEHERQTREREGGENGKETGMLESVLRLMDICVTANVCQYLYTVIQVLLLLMCIQKLWGNSK